MRGYRYTQYSGRVSNDPRYSRGAPPIRDYAKEREIENERNRLEYEKRNKEAKSLSDRSRMSEDVSVDDLRAFLLDYAVWNEKNIKRIGFPFSFNEVIYIGEERYDIYWNGCGLNAIRFSDFMKRSQVANNNDEFALKVSAIINAMRNNEEPNKLKFGNIAS